MRRMVDVRACVCTRLLVYLRACVCAFACAYARMHGIDGNTNRRGAKNFSTACAEGIYNRRASGESISARVVKLEADLRVLGFASVEHDRVDVVLDAQVPNA